MTVMDRTFTERLQRIPAHGLGLSVDVYTPDLFHLVEALTARGLSFGYLEVFHATDTVLREARRRLPQARFAYHGEGLWLTQPDWSHAHAARAAIAATAAQLASLQASWINHECATKEMAGYSFGTYVPPLFTEGSADVVARQVQWLQDELDRSPWLVGQASPLVLLEVPPLTYFGVGDLSVPAFFRRIVEQVPCGLVLDIGHVWTIYRYSGSEAPRSVSSFLSEFLNAFPLERVVQIHLAGLALHDLEAPPGCSSAGEPAWLDAHAAPIPPVLIAMLEEVLSHGNLVALKGVALEVDTKSIPLIVDEFEAAQRRFGAAIHRRMVASAAPLRSPSRLRGGPRQDRPVARTSDSSSQPSEEQAARVHDAVSQQYRAYAEAVSRPGTPVSTDVPATWLDAAGLDRYREAYLPFEILRWGGDLRDMFPETGARLEHEGVSWVSFVRYWFREPRSVDRPYDFFLLKLDRFVEFVREVAPALVHLANREADALRDAYQSACLPGQEPASSVAPQARTV